jgi:hypothetical protein
VEKKMDDKVHAQQAVDDHYGGRVFLIVRQTAALLGISERLLDGLVRNGEIPSAPAHRKLRECGAGLRRSNARTVGRTAFNRCPSTHGGHIGVRDQAAFAVEPPS